MGGTRLHPHMQELVNGLTELGYEVRDESFEDHDEYGDADTYVQSIAWDVDGVTMKAMFGWVVDYNGDPHEVTHGWKFGYIEWFPYGVEGESFMSMPYEIIEALE